MNTWRISRIFFSFLTVIIPCTAWAEGPADALNTLWAECLATAPPLPEIDINVGSGSGDGVDESDDNIEANTSGTMADVLLPMLIESSGTPCAGMRDPDACTQWISNQTCDGLATALLPSVEAELSVLDAEFEALFDTGDVPFWARTVSQALGTIVTDCYSAETGTPLDEASLDRLRYWETLVATGLVGITRGQPVEQILVADCVQYLHETGCDLLDALQPGSTSMPTIVDGPCSDMLLWDRTFGE